MGTLDALKDRLSRLWNVSATLQTANVPTCPFQGAKVFEVIVESFTGRVGAGGGGTGRGAAPHQPIVANNNRNQTANHLLGKPIIRYRAINTQINSLEDE